MRQEEVDPAARMLGVRQVPDLGVQILAKCQDGVRLAFVIFRLLDDARQEVGAPARDDVATIGRDKGYWFYNGNLSS